MTFFNQMGRARRGRGPAGLDQTKALGREQSQEPVHAQAPVKGASAQEPIKTVAPAYVREGR